MEYIAFISESLQHEIGNMKGRHGTGLGRVGEKKLQVPGIVGLQRLHQDIHVFHTPTLRAFRANPMQIQ